MLSGPLAAAYRMITQPAENLPGNVATPSPDYDPQTSPLSEADLGQAAPLAIPTPTPAAMPVAVPPQPVPGLGAMKAAATMPFSTQQLADHIDDHHGDLINSLTNSNTKEQIVDHLLSNNLNLDKAFGAANLRERGFAMPELDTIAAQLSGTPGTVAPPAPVAPTPDQTGIPGVGNAVAPANAATLLPSADYNRLATQLQAELANKPVYPTSERATLNPLQGIALGLATFLDPHHAAADVAAGLQGNTEYVKHLNEKKLAQYAAEDAQHRENLQIIERMLGQQNERDRGVMTAQESSNRLAIMAQHYGQINWQTLRAQYQKSTDPSDILYFGQMSQSTAREMGIAGPDDKEINGKIRDAGRKLGKDLQTQINQQIHGDAPMNETDRANLQARIDALQNGVVGTDGKPVLQKGDLPNIPTSAQINKIRLDETVRHHKDIEDLASKRFEFAKTIAANREKDTTVRLMQADERIRQGVAHLQIAQQAQDVNAMRLAQSIIADGMGDYDTETANLYKQANDKARQVGAEIVKNQGAADSGNRQAKAKLSGLQQEQDYWKQIAAGANTRRAQNGLQPMLTPEQEQMLARIQAAQGQAPYQPGYQGATYNLVPTNPNAPVNPMTGTIGVQGTPGVTPLPGVQPPGGKLAPAKAAPQFWFPDIQGDVMDTPQGKQAFKAAADAVNGEGKYKGKPLPYKDVAAELHRTLQAIYDNSGIKHPG